MKEALLCIDMQVGRQTQVLRGATQLEGARGPAVILMERLIPVYMGSAAQSARAGKAAAAGPGAACTGHRPPPSLGFCLVSASSWDPQVPTHTHLHLHKLLIFTHFRAE